MEYTEAPNSLRITLLVLSALSFLPQLQRIWSQKTSAGISISYVLLNLIVATEQFTIIFLLMISAPEATSNFTHDPLSTGDWLNFAQISSVLGLFLVLFSICLYYRPSGCSARGYIKVYTAYLFISVIPELCDLIAGTPNNTDWPQTDYRQGFAGTHGLILNPLITILGIISALCQTPQIWHHAENPESNSSSFSLIGLATQSVVFTLVAISWVWRVVYTPEPGFRIGPDWLEWFWGYGWPVVDSAVFAGVQGGLFGCVLYCRRKGRGEGSAVGGETEPLLRGD
ncbi:hypothetical protein BDW59DRAFT_156332 [Aspergillus cavernicola]|uniref:Integral membrane protein n=1 Tax=Aspergillus cavernicola TaxID=176166 RepID=A0ABR4J2X8_9EURO